MLEQKIYEELTDEKFNLKLRELIDNYLNESSFSLHPISMDVVSEMGQRNKISKDTKKLLKDNGLSVDYVWFGAGEIIPNRVQITRYTIIRRKEMLIRSFKEYLLLTFLFLVIGYLSYLFVK